jgi:hypothetical protein
MIKYPQKRICPMSANLDVNCNQILTIRASEVNE